MHAQVGCWKAPYSAESIASFVPWQEVRPASGDILLIRTYPVPSSPALNAVGGTPLPELVRELRSRFPGSPVALWIGDGPPEHVIDLVRAATSASVRAILGGPAADASRLRDQLTYPQGLSTFVMRWASDAGYLPPGTVQQEVHALLDAPPNVRTLQRLAIDRQEAARTWRGRLQQFGLPTPRAWLGLSHSLHIAFFMQRNSTESLQTLSERLGMQTVAHMSQQFKRVFGLPPGDVRDLLGAEPLLHRWFSTRLRR
jgi:AraC-like DNA-binding protein